MTTTKTFTASEIRQRVAGLAWAMRYDEFCKRLDLRDDDYAERKWDEFRHLYTDLAKLGNCFDKLIESD